jgi:hypothetical protein
MPALTRLATAAAVVTVDTGVVVLGGTTVTTGVDEGGVKVVVVDATVPLPRRVVEVPTTTGVVEITVGVEVVSEHDSVTV